jgi:His/Glu/Gln/Arg/opine family amino acid ABC transporter permease subunit
MTSSLPTDYWGRISYLLSKYGSSFLQGAGKTLVIALVGTFFGCLIGFLVGIVQTIPIAKNDPPLKKILLRFVRIILSIYVEVFRGTPMMVQAMFIYFGAMQYLNLHMGMWTAAFVIVSINTGAYMAETVRGGVLSVDIGQTEGARAIGMTHFQTMLYVVFPQALRNIIPQIGNNLIINIKDSSVLSVIGTIELFYVAKQNAGTYYWYFEAMSIAMAIYLVMTFVCSRLLRWWERKLDGPANYDLATTDSLAYTSGMVSFPGSADDMFNEHSRDADREGKQ